MTWELRQTLLLTADWQYTPVIEQTLGYVRLKHSTTGIYSKLLIAQAQRHTAQTVELWDFHSTFAKAEYDLFQFVCPPFFDERRLAFKIIRASGMLAEWSVQIEINTQPLYNAAAAFQETLERLDQLEANMNTL